jgi:integrase
MTGLAHVDQRTQRSPSQPTSTPRSIESATVDWPETRLNRAALADLACQLPFWQHDTDKRTGRGRSTQLVLGWLETFPAETWQQRWQASDAESAARAWHDALVEHLITTAPAMPRHMARRHANVGIGCLLCLRVLRPGYDWMISSHFSHTYGFVRASIDPGFFTAAAAALERDGHRERIRLDVLHHLTRVVVHTGRGPWQLTTTDLLDYHAAVLASGRQADSFGLTWEVLRETNVFPDGTPSFRAARHRGQRGVAELVDDYELVCQPVRDVLIRYLTERSAELDYTSLRGLVALLTDAFWKDLEEHHPGISTLDLPPDVAAAWKQRAGLKRRRGKGQPRLDRYPVLFAVRAFYLDIAHWALEDPSWAPWAVRCPIRDSDVRGSMKQQRQRRARMHQRTRLRAPSLPALVNSVEEHLDRTERLLAAAGAAAVGDTFDVDGEQFQRIAAMSDLRKGGQRGAGRLRVRQLATGEHIDVTKAEDEAFWTWAIVETLRHTGIRHEELLELTHLALVTHTLPDTGEVVPLLQIAPSKLDKERLLLVSPELAHVLARVIHRVRGGQQQIPLVARYDGYERVTGPPLPHLFQRRHGAELRVMSPGVAHRLLKLAIERAKLVGPDGKPVRYTPHDFRRIWATDAVSGGLPVHIAAHLLGHAELSATQIYVAVYQDDVIRHHRAFIARRRALRPSSEYREPTAEEWAEFEQHFAKRKVGLGTCMRPYGSDCQHEHACIRCPLLRPDPAQEPRLLAIIVNLNDRLREAQDRGWFGEIDGLRISLDAANQKLAQMRKIRAQSKTVQLPVPTTQGLHRRA